MARLLKYKDTPEPGVWHPISGERARRWRKEKLAKVQEKPGVQLEWDVGRRRDLEQADSIGRDTAVVQAPARDHGIREGRETVEVLAKNTLDWVLSGTPDEVRHKVGIVQHSSGMTHLTPEEAFKQLSDLAVKLARIDAERVFAERDLNKPVQAGSFFRP